MPFSKLVYDLVNSNIVIVARETLRAAHHNVITFANRTKRKAGLKLTYRAPNATCSKKRRKTKNNSERYTHIYEHLCVDAYERPSTAVIQM